MDTNEIIYNITTDINNSSDGDDLNKTVEKHINKLGAENFFFGAALYHDLQPYPDIYALNGYPEKWQERYDKQNYFEKDMTVAHCIEKSTPILWPVESNKISDTNKKIFSEASNFGIKTGISFPYHSRLNEYGALAVSVSSDYKNSYLSKPETLFGIQILGAVLFDHYKSKTKEESINVLTKREGECLKWVAAGKTSWETSVILGVSERTVIFHVQNAAAKMNTASRTNAAIIAILNGEIKT